MTITEVKGIGMQKGHTETYHSSKHEINFAPKTKIEVVLPDTLAQSAIAAVIRVAETSDVSDGKIFLSSVENAIRVITEEIREDAL